MGKMFFGKKADSPLYSNLIFLILNLAFFSILLIFVLRAGSGSLVYEQIYAKQIALMLDSSKPGMEIRIDLSKAKEIAEKNNWKGELVKIQNNLINVSLASNGGYSFEYFTNYKIESSYQGDILVLKVEK